MTKLYDRMLAHLAAIFTLALAGCESTTQTAIRDNQPPAIAYVVAAERGQLVAPTLYQSPVNRTIIIRDP